MSLVARWKLSGLEQSGSVGDYVKEFIAIVRDIGEIGKAKSGRVDKRVLTHLRISLSSNELTKRKSKTLACLNIIKRPPYLPYRLNFMRKSKPVARDTMKSLRGRGNSIRGSE